MYTWNIILLAKNRITIKILIITNVLNYYIQLNKNTQIYINLYQTINICIQLIFINNQYYIT